MKETKVSIMQCIYITCITSCTQVSLTSVYMEVIRQFFWHIALLAMPSRLVIRYECYVW